MTTDAHQQSQVLQAINSAKELPTFSPIELAESRLKPRDALLLVSDEAEVWRSVDGEAYATVRVDGHLEHHAVQSREFWHWLRTRLYMHYTLNGRPAAVSEATLRDVANIVEARAWHRGPVHAVALRVTESNDELFIDLGTEDWSLARVTAGGWTIVPTSPTPVLRSRGTKPFAPPEAGGNFGPLRQLLGHLDDETFIMLVAWCLGALLPRGPYPVLILSGEQGSGKSTLAKALQRIVDPSHAGLLPPPANDRDLVSHVRHRRLLPFDNLSGIRPELADSLCRLATGGEIGGRALFTDHGSASFNACRPMIINGISDLTARADLTDRGIALRLPTLSRRVTEKDWEIALERALPATFGALLNALSVCLQFHGTTPTPNVRMADFARCVVAAETALPWDTGAFVAAYERTRLDAVAALIEGDCVAEQIQLFVPRGGAPWVGSMNELYRILQNQLGSGRDRPSDWPGNARWLGDRLQRVAPALRTLGLSYTRRKRGPAGTPVVLQRID